MSLLRLLIIITLSFVSFKGEAQTDSPLHTVKEVSYKYIEQVDKKVDQYTHRIASKTEKTLTKLARWEEKIRSLLQGSIGGSFTDDFGLHCE